MGNVDCGFGSERQRRNGTAFDSLTRRRGRGGGGEEEEVDENVNNSNDASYVGRSLSKHALCSNQYTEGHFGPIEWERFRRKCMYTRIHKHILFDIDPPTHPPTQRSPRN